MHLRRWALCSAEGRRESWHWLRRRTAGRPRNHPRLSDRGVPTPARRKSGEEDLLDGSRAGLLRAESLDRSAAARRPVSFVKREAGGKGSIESRPTKINFTFSRFLRI